MRKVVNNFFLSLVAICCWSVTAFGDGGDRINVGVVIPLTGNAAGYGLEASRAVQVIEQFPDINSKVRFIVEDGRCGVGNAAATAVQKLVSIDSVKVLLIGCSGEILQTASIIERNRIPAVCVLCSHPDVKHSGNFIFRTFLDIEPGVDLISNYLSSSGFRRIAVLTEISSFTDAIERRLKIDLESGVVFADTAMPEEQDFRNILVRARSKRPDAFYLNAGSPPKYQIMLRQLRDMGLDVPVFAYFNPGEKTSRENLRSLQEGVIFFDTPDVDESNATPAYREFLNLYRKKFPEGVEAPFLLATAFNALQAILQGVEYGGADREKIVSFWKHSEIGGAQGKFRFDSNGDIVGPKWALRKMVGGKSVAVDSLKE